MKKQALLSVMVLVVCLALVGLGWVQAQPQSPAVHLNGTCPPVQNTPFFTIVYGTVSINGTAAPFGTVVEARSPRGDTVGCFVVSEAGNYGSMYVYGEDTTVTPPIPGMRNGEEVLFYVDGMSADANPVLLWANDKELHQVALSAEISTITPTPTDTPTATPTNTPTSTPTGSPWGVTLVNFSAEAQVDAILLTWETASEINVMGFYVQRSLQEDIGFQRISGFIPAEGDLIGAFYDYTDTDVTYNQTYYYRLEALGANGDTEIFGSISAILQSPTPTNTPTPAPTNTPPPMFLPDLSVQDMQIAPEFPVPDQSIVVTVTLQNQGGAAVETLFYTDIYADHQPTGCDDTQGYYQRLNSLAIGEIITLSFTHPGFDTVGLHNLYAQVDSACSIDESAETNNIYGPLRVNVVADTPPPVADFSAAPTSGTAPLTVQFTDLSTGQLAAWSWAFGDGVTGTLQSPTHTYTLTGTFAVSLTVNGPGGSDTETKAKYITVSERFCVYLPLVLRSY